ncbi:MAG: phosphomannomutase/phosphoglucomutase [Gammaproteobacteria bacterium]
MKLSLASFLRRDKSANDQPVSKPMPQLAGDIKPASVGKVRFQLLLAGVVLLGVLAAFIFQLMSGHILRATAQQSKITTQQVALRVAAMTDYYGSTAALLAKDPDLAYLLMVGNESALQSREESLRYVFPKAINVQLLPPGITEVDKNASPPLSHAALAQMRAAEAAEDEPPIEVHLFTTPQQHINIAHRVVDPAGSGVVGHLMVSLSADVLQNTLDDIRELDGYIEVQQDGGKGAPVVIARFGEQSLKRGDADRVVYIEGSRWQVAYWPVVTGLVALGGISMWVLGALIASAAVLVALIIVLMGRINKALRVDQVSMVTIMKDYRDGRPRRVYPSGLAELHESIEFMIQLAAGSQAGEQFTPASREQDASDHAAVIDSGDDKGAPDKGCVDEGVAADFGSAIRSDNLILEEDPLFMEADDEIVDIDPSIFRAYDIRGVVDQSLTTTAARLIGRAIGSEALQRGRDTVVVGRDGRLSGPSLSEALISGIISTGCNVKDIGVVPTPVLYFATYYLDSQSGVVVTGSHNPPDYNGLKIVIDGETLSGESIQSLHERIKAGKFIFGEGNVEEINVIPDYIERIRGDVTVARPLKVVVDCGNGVAGGVIPSLLKGLGCEVTELFCEVDGNFPNHHPDPSKAENMQDLITTVGAEQADIGLAFDGDGDRLGVVTADGRIIWPDRVLMLYAIDILARNPGGQIIYDVKCTRYLDAIIREHGGEPLMWKTGHSFIKAKIRETGALLAGEMSGHIFIKERWFGFDDALYAAARLLEILARDERSSTEVFAALPDSVNTPEINVTMREGEPPVFIEQLLESAHFEGATVSTIDGLRADFEDGWGLVRASNTTPVLVLRFEADNEEALARIMGDFRRVMLQVNMHLSLPF